ncbi:MAG: L-aspartate oxidase [Candidatus Magasanikbacteria bacterium CG10_big_fil_rev_8_21_14_0_10_40_10]|uniref:L-aspartate oxidase n=1 Tax=Candidatus Magasanikbacteria bacterium CG10_big_fil_rev_8_21_14_0_10_40_10 TaxID=1974648 RepID=A0A2M6W2X5_9BACT|nr:MAG: L-aspartate oxidase [Candidatus Magasanikbacteria bacterium CG10_big_fil_rev_8_21_14_0_10_40_10]
MAKNIFQYDCVVIGSGIAGLGFALQASKKFKIAIITKKELMESNSNYAQGGIAAVLDRQDSFAKHIQDTLEAGCYLNNKTAVRTMVEQAPQAITWLIELGAGFNRENTKIALTKEGGHSARRIAHAKDATGKEIERALIFNVRRNKNIDCFESHIAIDLLVKDGACYGVVILNDEKKQVEFFKAKSIVLATGGLGQVYERNCNPKIATGDGFAIANRVGARLKHMEFVQFHPTALFKKGQPAFLLSETLRGEGAILVDKNGRAFMKKYHPQADLAPRDIVSRAVFEELKKGPVYLDARSLGAKFIKIRFPYIYDKLWWYGFKMDKDLIPIAPAAHYACGGVQTDLNGRTNIKNLYVVGETAHTGVHGGNRLASNSLLECVVFSRRAAKAVIREKQIRSKTPAFSWRVFKVIKNNNHQVAKLKRQVRELMWQNVGIVRQEKNIDKTLSDLKKIERQITKIFNQGVNRGIIELRNLVQTALLITQSAKDRKISACAHYLKK